MWPKCIIQMQSVRTTNMLSLPYALPVASRLPSVDRAIWLFPFVIYLLVVYIYFTFGLDVFIVCSYIQLKITQEDDSKRWICTVIVHCSAC